MNVDLDIAIINLANGAATGNAFRFVALASPGRV
jgi:hypothetical protein